MLSAGGCNTLLFVVGVLLLASGCFQIVMYTKATQGNELITLSHIWRTKSTASIDPSVLIWFTISATSCSLIFSTVFVILDLVGMIVLRSSMWHHISRLNSGINQIKMPGSLWDIYAQGCGGVGRGDFWGSAQYGGGKGYGYELGSVHGSLRWWQRWVFLEDMVFGMQRNIARIRLVATTVLALLWSPLLVQLVFVAITGGCSLRSKTWVDTEHVCGLLRQGMVGSSVSWGCWMLLAVLLTLTNTNSTSITVRNVLPQHHQYSGFSPMGALDYGPVPGISAGISSSSSKQDPIGSGCVTAAALANPSISSGLAATAAVPNSSSLAFVGMPSHGLSHSGASSSSQAAAPKQQSSSSGSSGSSNISNTSGRRATTGLLGGNILRSSWSHTEDESIIGESRSDLSTQDRSQLVLQSQMLQQFYRLQNQQFQSLHQFQPPSRISEEPSSGRQAGPQQQRHRSRYSAASTASDQQLDLGNEDDGVEQRGGAQAYSVPLHVLEQVAREERGGSRSLASLAGGGGAAIGNSSSSKRNTIG